ncbi:keratinocyte-associated protein 2-like [Actinia tenebrosa]|uniref:Keratinocyte-associated protein 2-like n=1 Tax=Actinia tenebrosa TaxID=6105 RepID=A0A6P8IXZ2_ACTTE|nr:keratinocyte-associated protein 2-like [Actinia tenebrosa]
MAIPTAASFLFASTLTVVIFAAMQMFKNNLASSEWMTILGGFAGSQLFVFLLTAVGNLETCFFGKNFQTKLFPEVLACLGVAMFASGLVHRVCVTTCFLFSIGLLYYLNRISAATHTPVMIKPTQPVSKGKKSH